MKRYYIKALSLINDYIRDNQLDINRLIGYEISNKYYEIINAVKLRSCSFDKQNNNIYLGFTINGKK